ncbi:MAG: pirin family protein [Ramlibacter sp.]|nr:pirin family protein [Ramlibacter sp.]
MSATATLTAPELLLATPAGRPRAIMHLTRGRGAGPIVRLVSPSDVGELIKPFVFLDHFDMQPTGKPMNGMHPHSGIATLTLLVQGQISYEDTIGKSGVLQAGGLEWMRASGGAWHDGAAVGADRVRGLQLWMAMPPRFENAAPDTQYVAPEDVPQVGPVRVLLGQYGGVVSPISAPGSATYLYVNLKQGERWRYTPTPGHTVAWAYALEGAVRSSGHVLDKTLAVYEDSDATIEFTAETDTGFALGSAARHPYPLVLGYYSVHTSQDALNKGEAQIARIGERLREAGRIG